MPMVELLVFFIGIFLIATPVIALILLVRYSKVRAELNRLNEENARQHTSFQRELADLKRQLSAVVHPAAPTSEKPLERPVVAPSPAATKVEDIRVPSPQVELPAPVKLPPAVSVPSPSVQPPLPSVRSEPKPVIPAAGKTPAEVKPSAPVATPQTTPPSVPSSQPSAPRIPAPKPQEPAPIPPASAARVSAPTLLSAYRVSPSRPTLQQRMKTVSAIEETLGTNWLNKLGIIILVVGVALFGIYELGALGPLGKVGISYLASAFLLVGGIYLEKNERYRLLGRTGIGGGWALFFFSTYAIYHVAAMHVVDSLSLDCILMLVVAIAMAAHTLRYRSQFVTGLAFLLGYTTVALSQDTVYSLSAGVVLAIGLVSIVLKMGWFELEVFGILSSYLNHLYVALPISRHRGRSRPALRAIPRQLGVAFFLLADLPHLLYCPQHKNRLRRTYLHACCSLKRPAAPRRHEVPIRPAGACLSRAPGCWSVRIYFGPIAHHQTPPPSFRRTERGWRDSDARRSSFPLFRKQRGHPLACRRGDFHGSWDHRERSCFPPPRSPDGPARRPASSWR